ncbi:MAG: hypothetical protein Q9222_007427 [Ikaeria aurantiellina]
MASSVSDSLHTCYEYCKQASIEHPRTVLYILLFSSGCVWLLGKLLARHKPVPIRRAASPDLEKPATRRGTTFKAPEREPGVWTPVEFKRPAPPAYPDWDVYETKPLPYRPFRHGPYHITMGLRTMQWDEWIELDNHYLRFHGDKKRRIEERGEKCCKTAPEAYDGAVELLEELCDYLPQRYPTLFQTTPTGIRNIITNEDFDITTRPLPEDPMQTAGRLIQDDLAIIWPILPPRRRYPPRRLLAPQRQVRHAPQRDPHLRRRPRLQAETGEGHDEFLPPHPAGATGAEE